MEITLQRGKNTAAVTTAGGELISFQDGTGTEFIWRGDPAYWSGRNPVLFPIVGNLKDGRVEIKGKPYEMARHGFARRSEFTVADRGEDYVTLALRENRETLAQYPYPFLLEVTHRVTDSGFSTAFAVTNTGGEPLPFCIGAHTGIACPLHPGERFEDYALVFDQAEDARTVPITAEGLISPAQGRALLERTNTIPLTYGLIEECATIIFDGLRSTGVGLINQSNGRGVHMDFAQWPMIAFWTARAGAPYLCLEPWCGCAALEHESGRFEDKPHCVILPPGEKAAFRYGVTVV